MTKAELQAALDRADAELTQYLGWKLSAQLESKRAEAADEMCLTAIARAERAAAQLAQCQAWRQDDADNLNHCIRARQKLEAKLAERDTPCVWVRADDGWFESGCNVAPYTTRAPKFCPRCGHPVKVAEAQP